MDKARRKSTLKDDVTMDFLSNLAVGLILLIIQEIFNAIKKKATR